jgi:hypothetical protein
VGPVVIIAQESCGELVTVATHSSSTTAYSFSKPPSLAPREKRVALVLLVGGPGFLDLDYRGCPLRLTNNSLVRKRELFRNAGFPTALVDAPSDHHGSDGLAEFRISPQHAEDLGKVISDVRQRTNLPVWLIGTSRGAISAANAAARLQGAMAPEGLVVTSPVTSGHIGGYKAWVSQTIFSTPLEAIRVPVLAVVHADDKCIRSPPDLIGRITDRTNGVREQTVTVTGGPGSAQPSTEACGGRSPHGFLGQEVEVAAGIVRFIGNERY